MSKRMTNLMGLVTMALLVSLLGACATVPRDAGPSAVESSQRLEPVDLSDPLVPRPLEDGAKLSGAKNEWVSFVLRVSDVAPNPSAPPLLRVSGFQGPGGARIEPDQFVAYQILPMPVQVNQAGYVRHTGATVATTRQPRALLPLSVDRGLINLTQLRNPDRPADRNTGLAPGESAYLWIELRIPTQAPAGDYTANVELNRGPSAHPLARLSVALSVYDFVMPDERHLQMVSALSWESLIRLFPDRFEAVTPRLLNRTDPRYQRATQTLDQLVKLAAENRAELVIRPLQPTVKWPSGQPPVFDWEDFDSLVRPWMSGADLPDRTPLGFWPLPQIDFLDNYDFDRQSIADYWSSVATHFEQLDWLSRAPALIGQDHDEPVSGTDAISLSAKAALILQAHPRIQTMLPMTEDQVRFNSGANPSLPEPRLGERMIVMAPGLVFAPPIRDWPEDVPRPQRWLRTDQGDRVPFSGVGATERDVRLWAWLASLRQARIVFWDAPLPQTRTPDQLADPSDVTWFYPGDWFGLDRPVPTLQLKWIRRAQQDFEYLLLARQRGQIVNAIMMARLITKPVEIQPTQTPDPLYATLCGTTDQRAWDDAHRLLARTILLRRPGEEADPSREHALNLDTLRWMQPLERPIAIGRSTTFGPTVDRNAGPGMLDVRVGIDLYNASDSRPDNNLLQWTALPAGWHVRPQATEIPPLATYNVRRFDLDGRFGTDERLAATPSPIEITFTNGFTGATTPIHLMIPIAACDRREADLQLDGSLGEWTTADAIQQGPMVRMINRPAVQNQQLQFASATTGLYTAWAQRDFYLAFKLHGISTADVRSARNFVEYQSQRAWGEDLAEVLVQAVYDDSSVGPLLHLVVKPGGLWVERKLDARTHADPWQPVVGADIRYAGTVEPPSAADPSQTPEPGQTWRGEIAIPWKTFVVEGKPMPRFLRFNFAQHRNDTGESATWAGPVDFGRDDAFTGLLVLRSGRAPGMR